MIATKTTTLANTTLIAGTSTGATVGFMSYIGSNSLAFGVIVGAVGVLAGIVFHIINTKENRRHNKQLENIARKKNGQGD